MFANATRLAVLLAGRNPKWSDQSSYSGAPSVADAGVFLEDAPITRLDVQLRENLKYRRGRISVVSVENTETYNVDVRQTTCAFTSSGSATEVEIVNGIVRAVNAKRLDVRARAVDENGDNNVDTVYLESNQHAIHVDSAAPNEDYTVTINGVDHTFSEDGSANVADILDNLAQSINTSSVGAKAFPEDTNDDGNTDTMFIEPIENGSLSVGVSATGFGGLVLDATGKESDNPSYSLPGSSGSAELSLDADAIEGTVRFFTTYQGDGQVPGGWRQSPDDEWNIGYRGLDEVVPTGGNERGYIEFDNGNEGTARTVAIGPATLED